MNLIVNLCIALLLTGCVSIPDADVEFVDHRINVGLSEVQASRRAEARGFNWFSEQKHIQHKDEKIPITTSDIHRHCSVESWFHSFGGGAAQKLTMLPSQLLEGYSFGCAHHLLDS